MSFISYTACHSSCGTCIGPASSDCSTCPEGFNLTQSNTCECANVCNNGGTMSTDGACKCYCTEEWQGDTCQGWLAITKKVKTC